jgi:hypothetical protein
MTSRKVLLGVLSATALLTATGYQGAASASSTVGSPVGQGENHAPAPSPVPEGWKKIGTPVNGFSVAIPPGWVDIDLTAADLKEALEKAGIEGASQANLQASLNQLKGLNALYAIDAKSVSSGFATNLNGFCQNVARPVDQMKEDARTQLTQVGATDLEITDSTVAGQPAVRIDYHLKAARGLLKGLQVQIPTTGGKTCVLTITALDNAFPSSAQQILDTFTTL